MAKKTIKPDDEVQYIYYSVSHNDQSGCVVLSNRKLLFVSEKGFFKKTYDVVFEMSIGKFDEITKNGNVLTLVEGEKRHLFKSGYVSAIERTIKSLTAS